MSDEDKSVLEKFQWEHGFRVYGSKTVEALLEDWQTTNKWMFNEQMSKLHEAAPYLAALLVVTLKKLELISQMSDVGVLFDGHDELNEFTHEENARLMEKTLDRIKVITRPGYFNLEDE